MYPQADSVVRTLMPAVLEVAGMRGVAEHLRRLGPVLSSTDAESACVLLSRIRELSDEAVDGWAELVEEAAFWAEAAVRSALDGDRESFSFCVGRVRVEMDAGWALMQAH
jgi:hypothetical protein